MSKKGSSVAAAMNIARRVKRAGGGGIFDWSGVGEAMPENIGKDQPIRDPLVNVPKRMLYDLPREMVDRARETPLPGLRREDVTDQPEWGAPDPKSMAGRMGLSLPTYNASGPYDPIVASSTEMAGNLMGTGASFAQRGAAGIFGGRLAKTADHAALARAEKLEGFGEKPEYIHQETGWFRGPDDKWRFEINDQNAELRAPIDSFRSHNLGESVDHPELAQAYPDLMAEGRLLVQDPMKEGRGRNGAYAPASEDIGREKVYLTGRASFDQSRSTTLHELQHAVQEREGFVPGSNPSAMQQVVQAGADARLLAELGSTFEFQRATGRAPHPAAKMLTEQLTPEQLAKIETDPYEAYRRIYGEVEARNVQWRRNWTPEERRSSFPGSTEDIPREKQLIGAPHDPAAQPLAADVAGPAADAGAVGPGGGGAPGARSLPEAQATAAQWAGERKPLEGLPGALKIGDEHFVPGPIGKVHDVAEAYMREHHPDRPYTPPTKYHPIDQEHSKAIAQAYEDMQHTPNDPATKASYSALIDETAKQYEAIKKTGLKIEPIRPGMEDPYAANPRLAARDVAENNHLWFFPTEGGFGSGEFIKSAAIRHRNGKVYEGALHSDAYEAAATDTGHNFGKIVSKTRPEDSGFVTSKGRFVSREEAAKIARESKQAPHVQNELSAEYLPEGYEHGPLSDNPMLRKTGEKIGDHPLLANDMFRIVHDYFGHLKEGHGFRAAGEDNAWRTHAQMYSDIARPAMTTETRGQNSWVNYGPHGEKNRTASAADTTYADQKVGLLPEWTMRDRDSPAPVMVYHGTPHSFNRFDISKIGEGEGNQAYGHGLYFAGHEPVSEWYRHQLSTRQDPLLQKYGLNEVGHVIGSHLSDVAGDPTKLIPKYVAERDRLIASGADDKATTNMIKEYDRRIQYLGDPERATGHVYQVGMNVNPEHLLDYDATFNSQTPHVQGRTGPMMEQSIAEQKAAIERLLDKGGMGEPGSRRFRPLSSFKKQDLEGRLLMLQKAGPAPFKGSDIYQRFGLPAKDRSEAAVKAAQNLRNVDIPGMRYKDAGSRAPGQQGSHNYVMFGDDMLKILRKYGVVGIPAAGVLAADGEERRAMGGKVSNALALARDIKRASGGAVHTGAIMGHTDGRADEVPMEVPDGAYVLTADHVSSMGEGNTLSGFKKLDQMFPASAKKHSQSRAVAKRARGGAVPIYAADGEYVICPEDITDRWGDLEAGHRYLDAWQTSSRKEHVNTLRNLAPPAQD